MPENISVTFPEFTSEYIKEIENSWLEHFKHTEVEKQSYFQFLFRKHLKELLDEFISNLPLEVKSQSNFYKIHCHSAVILTIAKDLINDKYKGFNIKTSDILPSPFLIFASRIE